MTYRDRPVNGEELADLSASFEAAAAKAKGAGAALDLAIAEGRWDPDAKVPDESAPQGDAAKPAGSEA